MRAVLVAAVLVLGMAGHWGAAGAGAPLPEVAVELLAAGFSAPVFLVAPMIAVVAASSASRPA